MRNLLKFEAVFEDLRKLGIGLMLVGFIGMVIQKDVSAINGGILTGLGAIIWAVGIIKWTDI
ncbi:MAG: hypothetical protein AB8B89_00025 [Gammaproteobacteria bacterium]